MNKLRIFMAVAILFFILSGAIHAQVEGDKYKQANEIISNFRDLIFKDSPDKKLLSFRLTTETTGEGKTRITNRFESNRVTKTDSTLEFDWGRFLVKLKTDEEIKFYSMGRNNVQRILSESVLNAEDATYKSESIPAIPDNLKMMIPEDKKSTSEDRKIKFRESIFPVLFPMIADETLISSKFYYVGIAEVGRMRANMLEATDESGVTRRLFFDEDTNKLIAFMVSSIESGTKKEDNYYFSEFAKLENLNIPTKIEHTRSAKSDSRDSQLKETTLVKSFSTAIEFEENHFKSL